MQKKSKANSRLIGPFYAGLNLTTAPFMPALITSQLLFNPVLIQCRPLSPALIMQATTQVS